MHVDGQRGEEDLIDQSAAGSRRLLRHETDKAIAVINQIRCIRLSG